MPVLIISFVVSIIVTGVIVRYNYIHEHITADHDLDGIQKFHVKPVPRIGGVGIIVALSFIFIVRYASNENAAYNGLILTIAALPVFLMGLVEDLTKKVGVKVRLIAALISALISGFWGDAWLSSLQIFGVDNLMATFPVVAICITCFAVAGLSNAFNLIDGYNGLSSMVGVIILCGLSYVAFEVSDVPLMFAAKAMIGAIIGFMFWNYPRGLIFLGDGGAYLVGFWVAELSILLTARHPEISKWFPLLLCLYPVFETLFTIYRRVVVRRSNPGLPDAMHLHQLVYMRVVRWCVGSQIHTDIVARNSLTSPYLWLLCLMSVLPAVMFWKETWLLRFFSVLFITLYIYIYRQLVLFKVPSWLKARC